MVESAKRAVENGVDEQTLVDLYDQGLVLLDNTIDNQVENLTIIKAEDEDDLANEVISRRGGVSQLSNEDINYYFDFKKYGHDLILGGDFTKLPHGAYVELSCWLQNLKRFIMLISMILMSLILSGRISKLPLNCAILMRMA